MTSHTRGVPARSGAPDPAGPLPHTPPSSHLPAPQPPKPRRWARGEVSDPRRRVLAQPGSRTSHLRLPCRRRAGPRTALPSQPPAPIPRAPSKLFLFQDLTATAGAGTSFHAGILSSPTFWGPRREGFPSAGIAPGVQRCLSRGGRAPALVSSPNSPPSPAPPSRPADPDWASYKLGIFVCLHCSGVHRNFPDISKVKSVRLDFWDDSLVEVARGAWGGGGGQGAPVLQGRTRRPREKTQPIRAVADRGPEFRS